MTFRISCFGQSHSKTYIWNVISWNVFFFGILWVKSIASFDSARTSREETRTASGNFTNKTIIVTISDHTFKDATICFCEIANFLRHLSSELISKILEVRHVCQTPDFGRDSACEKVICSFVVLSERNDRKQDTLAIESMLHNSITVLDRRKGSCDLLNSWRKVIFKKLPSPSTRPVSWLSFKSSCLRPVNNWSSVG